MKKISSLIIFMIMLFGVTYGQTYLVIVNKSNNINSISKSELSDYFMKKSVKFPNGLSVLPVDQKATSPIRTSFTTEIHNKSVTAVRSFWQQSVFQGKATPPVEKQTDEDIIEYVSNNPEAIGYVSSTADTSTVKIISIK